MDRLAQLSSHFADVPLEPPDAIFGLAANFKNDPHVRKADLVVGAYRGEDGKPWVLPVVSKVENAMVAQHLDHEYIPIDGLRDFTDAAAGLLLGKDGSAFVEKRFSATQFLSGTGCLRLGAQFLAKFYKAANTVYIPDPTWANHRNIFNDAGLAVKSYRYYDKKAIALDYNGLIEDLKNASNGSIILLHVCAHNPTGVDPSEQQWKGIAAVMQEKGHFPFFDSAYQGFATGDLNRDAYSVRLFASLGMEFFCAQSFAKNMGLYGERVGNLIVVCKTATQAENVRSQMKRLIRGLVSNPPAYGARIAARILNTPELFAEWDENVKVMANRIKAMRQALYDALIKRKTPGNWDHILNQIGMFTFTGLTAPQCEALMSQHHVYLTTNGRISMAGLNTKNVDYVADAIHNVVVNVK